MRRGNVIWSCLFVSMLTGCQTATQSRVHGAPPVVDHKPQPLTKPAQTRQAAALQLTDDTIGRFKELGFPIDRKQLSVVVAKKADFNAGLERNAKYFEVNGVFDALSLLARLFGIPRGRDPRELKVLAEASLSDATLAYYDHIAKSLVIRDDTDARILNLESLVAHELGHAYQDQAQGGLATFILNHRSSLDGLRAAHGVLEGQAVVIGTGVEWFGRGVTVDRLDPDAADASIGRLTSGESFSVIYEAGRRFVLTRYREGGWRSVADAFLNPPSSTEQLLHPAKFRRDLPTHVTLPATPKSLDRLPLVFDGTVGELLIYGRLLLIVKGLTQARIAAAGWDGDHLQVYQKPDGGYAAVWRILWDRPNDAQQFEATVAKSLAGRELVSLKRRDRYTDLVYAESKADYVALTNAIAGHRQMNEPQSFDAESTAAAEEAWEKAERLRPYVQDERWILPEYGVSFRIPEGFVAVTVRGVELLTSLPRDGFAPNISLVYEQDLFDGDIARYVAEAKRQTSFTSQTWLSDHSVRIGQSPAAIIELEVPSQRHKIAMAMLILSRKGRWVTVTSAALADPPGQAMKTLGEIIQTLRVE